jgi:EAL domain-containing protein (putative c-di-GMP-specific phosphodiesterase class I)
MSREATLVGPGLFPGAGAWPSAPARNRRDVPGTVLLVGAVVTALLAAADIATGGRVELLRHVYVIVAPSASCLALFIITRRGEVSTLRYGPMAAGVAFTALAMALLDLVPLIGDSAAAILASACFVIGSVMTLWIMTPVLMQRMDRQTRIAAELDTTIMLLAGATVLLTVWSSDIASAGLQGMLLPLVAASLAGSALLASVASLAMRAVPANRGFWLCLPGVTLLSLCWILWVFLLLQGQPLNFPVAVLFSAGILLVSAGWATWDVDITQTRRIMVVARWLTEWVPMASIMLCAAIEAVPHGRIGGLDPAPAGTAVVVLLTIVRQRMLLVGEREATSRLASEVHERAQTMLSLARLERASDVENTSLRICEEALRLPGIDAARVYAIHGEAVIPIALEGIVRDGEILSEPVEPRLARRIRTRAALGPWVDAPSEACRPGSNGVIGDAFAPMRWDNKVIGVVSMGTTCPDEARCLETRLSTLTEFGVVSAALLGPMLLEQWQRADICSQLERVISDHAFMPVFQAVVDLRSRDVVGFEALTRFHDGTRPDQRFVEADSAGMSVRLETACISSQLEAASWLPAGAWVSLNVSPTLAKAVIPLTAALERADREIVLEITEHVEIDDYGELVGALGLLRGRARLAVDDAGAGYAGLKHILELKPQFVKLDISLVRNVDADPARQAMVAGMAHFARHADCELIAEGIETDDELAELIRLGVKLGQGYLFGKPGPVPTV